MTPKLVKLVHRIWCPKKKGSNGSLLTPDSYRMSDTEPLPPMEEHYLQIVLENASRVKLAIMYCSDCSHDMVYLMKRSQKILYAALSTWQGAPDSDAVAKKIVLLRGDSITVSLHNFEHTLRNTSNRDSYFYFRTLREFHKIYQVLTELKDLLEYLSTTFATYVTALEPGVIECSGKTKPKTKFPPYGRSLSECASSSSTNVCYDKAFDHIRSVKSDTKLYPVSTKVFHEPKKGRLNRRMKQFWNWLTATKSEPIHVIHPLEKDLLGINVSNSNSMEDNLSEYFFEPRVRNRKANRSQQWRSLKVVTFELPEDSPRTTDLKIIRVEPYETLDPEMQPNPKDDIEDNDFDYDDDRSSESSSESVSLTSSNGKVWFDEGFGSSARFFESASTTSLMGFEEEDILGDEVLYTCFSIIEMKSIIRTVTQMIRHMEMKYFVLRRERLLLPPDMVTDFKHIYEILISQGKILEFFDKHRGIYEEEEAIVGQAYVSAYVEVKKTSELLTQFAKLANTNLDLLYDILSDLPPTIVPMTCKPVVSTGFTITSTSSTTPIQSNES